MTNFDLIATSISKVNRTFYTHYKDGSQVHQISALEIITRMIRMLDPTFGDLAKGEVLRDRFYLNTTRSK